MVVATNGTRNELETLGDPTAGADEYISFSEPYSAFVRIHGTSPLLFHAWNSESVAEKAGAAKGSKAKKSDNVESYVYRNEKKEICIPSLYFTRSVANAGRFIQDPRSPRKSALDLFTAAIIPIDELCSLGSKEWDYLDRRRVAVQRNGVTRERPAFNKGWECDLRLGVLLPEYVSPELLHRALTDAGRLVGVGDFRPTYGRFSVVKFETVKGVPAE